VLGGHDAGRANEDDAEPNQQRQPVFEKGFHPEVRRLNSRYQHGKAEHPTSSTERPMAERDSASQF
jgi:hypothetical protein